MNKGIRHVAFSPDGKYIAASDMTDDHVCTIFELLTKKDKNGKMLTQIATGNGGKANVMSIGFNAASDQVVATCVKEVLFYSWNAGKITSKKGSGWGTGA
jgi:WD40 repeat protein